MSTADLLRVAESGDHLPVIAYREYFGAYQLLEDVRVVVDDAIPEVHHRFFRVCREVTDKGVENVLTAFHRYVWDGMTGGLDTERAMFPSLVHDVFCQATNEGLLNFELWRPYGDRLLAELLEKNMAIGRKGWRKRWAKIRAAYVLRAVRFNSKRKEKRGKPQKAKTAPAIGAVWRRGG